MATGVVVGAFSLFFLGGRVFLPRWDLVRVLVVCSVVGLLLPYRWTGARLRMEKLEWVLVNVLGVGPWLFTLLLAINLLFHGPVTCTTHKVAGVYRGFWSVQVELADEAFAEHPHVLRFDPARMEAAHMDSLHICVADGVLGPRVLVRREQLVQR